MNDQPKMPSTKDIRVELTAERLLTVKASLQQKLMTMKKQLNECFKDEKASCDAAPLLQHIFDNFCNFTLAELALWLRDLPVLDEKDSAGDLVRMVLNMVRDIANECLRILMPVPQAEEKDAPMDEKAPPCLASPEVSDEKG